MMHQECSWWTWRSGDGQGDQRAEDGHVEVLQQIECMLASDMNLLHPPSGGSGPGIIRGCAPKGDEEEGAHHTLKGHSRATCPLHNGHVTQ